MESPQEAKERAVRDGSDPTVKATCKNCGAERDYLTDLQIDAKLDFKQSSDGSNARTGLWKLIEIEPLPPMPEWDDLGPVR